MPTINTLQLTGHAELLVKVIGLLTPASGYNRPIVGK
jgi:hypothetical protein